VEKGKKITLRRRERWGIAEKKDGRNRKIRPRRETTNPKRRLRCCTRHRKARKRARTGAKTSQYFSQGKSGHGKPCPAGRTWTRGEVLV